jgi:hypothetical protein
MVELNFNTADVSAAQNVKHTYKGNPRRCMWTYRDAAGETLGIVARYDGPDGARDFLPFFKLNGHGLELGAHPTPRPLFGLDTLNRDGAVWIVEGEKCAAALHCLGFAAVSAPGGANAAHQADWTPLSGRPRALVVPDNDAPGATYAEAVCAALRALERQPEAFVLRLPGLPEAGDVVDFLRADVPDWDGFAPFPEEYRAEFRRGLSGIAKEHETPAPAEAKGAKAEAGDWPPPIPLDMPMPPPWPSDALPPPAGPFVNAVAASTETPPELGGLLALGTLAACAQGRFTVWVKPGYFEPLSLFVCPAMPSGTRKSAVHEAVTAPLVDWEGRERERLAPEISRAQSENATLETRIAHLRAQAAKAEGEARRKAKDELEAAEADRREVPHAPQVWVEDVTPERLGALMAENNERMAQLSDEGGIFETLAGRYSQGVPNLDLFLKGHAGSPCRVDRGSRDPVYLRHAALTVALSPQPEVLRGLAEKQGFRGRGLLARFLFALPAANVGYRRLDTPAVPEFTTEAWARLIHALLDMPPNEDTDGQPTPRVVKLGQRARATWAAFWERTEADMRDGGRFEHIRDWAGKLPGAVARIAALLHVVRHDKAAGAFAVEEADMVAAVRLGECLAGHALAAFDLMGADAATDGARMVLRWIRRERRTEFTQRDAHAACKGSLPKAEDVAAALHVLESRCFVARRRDPEKREPGRPSKVFDVNPDALAD